MKPCTALESLYSKHPDVMNRGVYQEHIETCPHCKADEAVFKEVIAALRETEAARRASVPSLDRQQRLLEEVTVLYQSVRWR